MLGDPEEVCSVAATVYWTEHKPGSGGVVCGDELRGAVRVDYQIEVFRGVVLDSQLVSQPRRASADGPYSVEQGSGEEVL